MTFFYTRVTDFKGFLQLCTSGRKQRRENWKVWHMRNECSGIQVMVEIKEAWKSGRRCAKERFDKCLRHLTCAIIFFKNVDQSCEKKDFCSASRRNCRKRQLFSVFEAIFVFRSIVFCERVFFWWPASQVRGIEFIADKISSLSSQLLINVNITKQDIWDNIFEEITIYLALPWTVYPSKVLNSQKCSLKCFFWHF